MLAIDPGPTKSAVVAMSERGVILYKLIAANNIIKENMLREFSNSNDLVIENIRSYGMPVGASVFDTVHWAGRFHEAWDANGGIVKLIDRIDVRMCLCRSSRARDGNIRAAIIDLYGGRELAVGRKKAPGLLYGVHHDLWSAVALAVTYYTERSDGKWRPKTCAA